MRNKYDSHAQLTNVVRVVFDMIHMAVKVLKYLNKHFRLFPK